MILDRLAIKDESFNIEVDPAIPRAGTAAQPRLQSRSSGSQWLFFSFRDEDINGIAFEAESSRTVLRRGSTNTLATFR